MKKILIIGSVVLSGLAFTKQPENPYVYNEPEVTVNDGDPFPGNPGDTASIDQSVFVLLLAAGIIIFTHRKKLAK